MSDKPYQDASVPYTLDEAIDELDRWLGNEAPLFPIEQAVAARYWLKRMRRTLKLLAEHEPSWGDDFIRARVSLGEPADR